jgi:hypothetical protein
MYSCDPLGFQGDACQTTTDCQPMLDCVQTAPHGFMYCYMPVPIGGACDEFTPHGNCVAGSRCVPQSVPQPLPTPTCIAYPGLRPRSAQRAAAAPVTEVAAT